MKHITFTYRSHIVHCHRTAPGEAWIATAWKEDEDSAERERPDDKPR